MPNRFLKESICTSENIDQLTEFQEVFFYRLMVNCDDFGRFDARPKLLASRLFPLRDIDTADVNEALMALQRADLITLYTVDRHPYLFLNTWLEHQQKRSDKSKYPDPPAEGCWHPLTDENGMITDDNKCYQMISEDNSGDQPIADDSKCARIRNTYSYNDIRNTDNDKRISISTSARAREDDDDDFHRIQSEHDRVLNAAEDAGFKMSNDVRGSLIALYADNGLQKVLDGLKSCVDHGAPNLAYLKAVLAGKPREAKKTVPAQKYEQRDYSGETVENGLAHMVAMINGAVEA